MLSLFQRHVADWKNCKRCPAAKTRKNTVLVRGSLPCDVLFVGEAPGESEDVLGRPFVGPAGQLLDHVIKRAFSGLTLTHALTNVVACIPRDGDGTTKLVEPSDEQVMACKPRLEGLARIAAPRLVVCVGKVAEEWLEPGLLNGIDVDSAIPRVNILHPAFILRANQAQQSLLIQKCVVAVRTAVEDL